MGLPSANTHVHAISDERRGGSGENFSCLSCEIFGDVHEETRRSGENRRTISRIRLPGYYSEWLLHSCNASLGSSVKTSPSQVRRCQ